MRFMLFFRSVFGLVSLTATAFHQFKASTSHGVPPGFSLALHQCGFRIDQRMLFAE